MKPGIVAAVLALSSLARAEAKPVVCLHYTLGSYVADEGKVTIAVCLDGKKPFVLTHPVEIRLSSPDGTPLTAIVGWR